MAASLPELVQLTAGAMPFSNGMEIACNAAQIVNDKKVTDHHAVIPTRNLQGADLSGLPVGEKAVLELVALRLLWPSPIPLRKPPLLSSAPERSLLPKAAQ